MSLFGRREPRDLVAEAHADATDATEPIVRAQGTYRVAFAHTDTEHANATPAHWGPAYNAGFADTLAHLKDVGAGSIDLLEEAKAGAVRCRAEQGPGYTAWVERLVSRDGESEWERVS